MTTGPGTSLVRRRLLSALPALALFTIAGRLVTPDVFSQSWFYVGLGTVLSATFVEPFFTKPQDAIVNAAGGVGAFVGVVKSPVEGLWWSYLAFVLLAGSAGLLASISQESRQLKWSAFSFASRFGRAVVVGTTALVLIVITEAARGTPDFEFLAVGTGLLLAGIAVDWSRLILRVAGRTESTTVLAAVGPRMLLSAAPGHDLSIGEVVELTQGGVTTPASVVARMPHASGLRYQLALEAEWTAVCAGFPTEVALCSRGSDSTLVGVVAEGTTERRIVFEPFRPLSIGTPLRLNVGDHWLLYQVARLELVASEWAGARAVVGQAVARLVGRPEGDHLRGGAYLPRAHDLIHEAQGATGSLPSGYFEIGRIKETCIPIGLRVDAGRRGHIAVLGMSGMGKTAVAQRISRAYGEMSPVIAPDTTGEYTSRLGFPRWSDGDLTTQGHFVYEPAGDPPTKAAQFIRACMSAGHEEYKNGETPVSRVVLLEEAHGFIPEWNFAQRYQQDQVSESARMIMQARKLGLTFVIVSQRTAVVTKSALSQCENYIILKTIDQTSLEYLETLVGSELREALSRLERFEALCVGPGFNSDEPVIVSLTAPNQ